MLISNIVWGPHDGLPPHMSRYGPFSVEIKRSTILHIAILRPWVYLIRSEIGLAEVSLARLRSAQGLLEARFYRTFLC